jgi:nitrate reductase gamma subunit
MGHYFSELFLGVYPYIALTVFVIGSWLRYESDPYGWRTKSSQLLSNKGMQWGSNLFHVGILLLFLGHFVGLLTPEWLYSIVISPAHKQILAMTAGGIFGSLCFVGLTILIWRRLFNPRIRATSSFGDIFILLLLYFQLILGLFTIAESAHHLDGQNMEALAYWAQHIVTFRPGAVAYLTNVPLLYKVHIVVGLTLFVVFPFTRLVHIWSAPVHYLLRTGYQIVRKRG